VQRRGAGGLPRIVAMTANAMPGDREAYIAAGMDGYVAKPIELSDLAAALGHAWRCRARRRGPGSAGRHEVLDAARLEHLRGDAGRQPAEPGARADRHVRGRLGQGTWARSPRHCTRPTPRAARAGAPLPVGHAEHRRAAHVRAVHRDRAPGRQGELDDASPSSPMRSAHEHERVNAALLAAAHALLSRA
jgi:CheY-like chemotaxis protein